MPENINRYCGAMNVKEKAVTAGHSFSELSIEVGTVVLMRVIIPEACSPVKKACIPKK